MAATARILGAVTNIQIYFCMPKFSKNIIVLYLCTNKKCHRNVIIDGALSSCCPATYSMAQNTPN